MFKFNPSKEWYKKMAEQEQEVPGADLPVGRPESFSFMPKWLRAQKEEEKAKADEIQAIVEKNEGSTFKVPLTSIVNITPHNNADKLEVVWVYGFQVISQKGKYKIGDKVVYIPIDSIIPEWLENVLFPEGSKITLTKRRVRQIRIRKVASQGMVVDPQDISSKVNPDYLTLEQDLSQIIGVTKYEPPVRYTGESKPGTPRNKPLENARFHKYGGIDNIKWYPDFFLEKEVVIQEKLHGSNCRISYARTSANTLWKKFLRLIGRLPAYEYCYGSNNVQLQERKNYTGFYDTDVYGAVLQKVDAFKKLDKGITVYGELIGPGIQKNYDYGHKTHNFVVFDVKRELPDGTQEFMNPDDAEAWAKEKGFDFVPVLYRGVFNHHLAKELSMGPSVYCPTQKVREGVVIKAKLEYGSHSSKKALKLISEDYLNDASNTDFH